MRTEWSVPDYTKGEETYETLRLFTQVVGKIKLAKLPWINHSWHVTLTVTPSGLTTLSIPGKIKNFQIDLDFVEHKLKVSTSEGELRSFDLIGNSVALFYEKVFDALRELKINVSINRVPNEIADAIPFDQDNIHRTYNPPEVEKLHKSLLKIQDIFTLFRTGFTGKCSPVHFFWGSFDLAVTRFSGRSAPLHPGGIPNLPDRVAQEAYSHELCSAGFWPGDKTVPFAAFYSYSYPEPEGYRNHIIIPKEAYYDNNLREFILPYNDILKYDDPSEVLLDFLQSTYEAAADSGKWNRMLLEKKLEKIT